MISCLFRRFFWCAAVSATFSFHVLSGPNRTAITHFRFIFMLNHERARCNLSLSLWNEIWWCATKIASIERNACIEHANLWLRPNSMPLRAYCECEFNSDWLNWIGFRSKAELTRNVLHFLAYWANRFWYFDFTTKYKEMPSSLFEMFVISLSITWTEYSNWKLSCDLHF